MSLKCENSENIFLTVDASVFIQRHLKLLKVLNLSGLTINEESAEGIAFGNKLQYLEMNGCKLTSKAAVIIAHKISIAAGIIELQLYNNSIDDN